VSETNWTLEIETERLVLRPQQPDDYQSWLAGFSGRLPQQSKYDEGPIKLDSFDREWFANSCQFHQQQALSDYAYIFGVFARHTNQHLGYVDLSTIQREEKQWANLGYSIHNQHWHQGFGTEAVTAAIMAGFETLGYHRIEAAINLDNHSSIALAEHVGLTKECIRRGFYYEDQQWIDHLIYAAIPTDFGLIDRPPTIGC
jgi:[ribosomal protein S5]-alanine N-acetyltransferase